ncbi:MAG: protein kinase domain-containing protein [Trebonia sp.]
MSNGETVESGGAVLLAGRYRVDGLLGRGGMSEVYFGYDERLDRRVAIKVLRQPSGPVVGVVPDSPEAAEILDARDRDRRRFLREIRVTARLEHPGTPAVYDTGVETGPDGTSRVWLVMQLLWGSTVEALLDRADFSASAIASGTAPAVSWAAAIAAQIAAVLADVHRVDIVHRDIKPSNVMVTEGGLVKVLDFGIAILQGASALPRLTQIDRTVGTPPYMSPEQCLGQPVAAASDVYSLGCLLCELLTGDQPFFGTESMPLRAHHLQTAPPAVRVRRPGAPQAIDALVTSMLAKDPSARPNAEAVYGALLPFALAEPVHAADQDQDQDQDQDPTRPFRRPLLATPMRPSDTAAERVPLTDAEVKLLLGNVEALLQAQHPAEAISLLEDAAGRAPDAAVALELRRALAAALFYAGEYTRAATLFDAVGSDYRRYLPSTDPLVLECAYHAGHAYAETGKPDKALPQLRYYVQNADPGLDADEAEKVIDSRFVVAQLLAASGEPDAAAVELGALRPLLATAFGEESTQVRNIDKQVGRPRTLSQG